MNRRGLLGALFALPFAPAALKAAEPVYLPSRLHYDDIATPVRLDSAELWPWPPKHPNCLCAIRPIDGGG